MITILKYIGLAILGKGAFFQMVIGFLASFLSLITRNALASFMISGVVVYLGVGYIYKMVFNTNIPLLFLAILMTINCVTHFGSREKFNQGAQYIMLSERVGIVVLFLAILYLRITNGTAINIY